MRNFALFFLFCSFGFAGADIIPKLVVDGTASLHKPSDQVSMNISVVTQAETAQEALVENNEKMQAVVNGLQEVGLQKGEYHTAQFSIQPIYSVPPPYPPQNWKSTIISYEVSNSLIIKSQKLDLTSQMIDASGKAGANYITNIQFSVKDPQMHRSEAIAQATLNALHDAQIIASVANLLLVRILEVKLDQPTLYTPPCCDINLMRAESSPFIEAPDVDISAHISLIFEVQNASSASL